MRIDSIFMSFTTRDNPMLHCAHSQLDQAMTWIKFGRRKFRTHLSRFMLPLTSRKKYGEDSSSFPLEAETGITGKNNLCSVCLLSELFRQVSWNSRNLEGRLFLEADRPSERTDVKKKYGHARSVRRSFYQFAHCGLDSDSGCKSNAQRT
jgi:hypothetical protein